MQALHAVKWTELLTNQSITHGATTPSAVLDMAGVKDGAVISIKGTLGGGTNGTNPTVVLQHSDDTEATNFGTTGLSDASQTMPSLATTALRFVIDGRGKKRYFRVNITAPSGSTNSNATVNVTAAQYPMESGAAALADLDANTNSTVVRV